MYPQAVHSSLTNGWMSHWTCLSRTCPNIGPFLHPLEDILCSKLLPSLTSQAAPNDTFRDFFTLPFCHGCLGLPNPVLLSTHQYQLVVSQCTQIPYDTLASQVHIRASIHSLNRQFSKEQSHSIRSCLSPQLQWLFDIPNEKNVSSWLTALPISDHGFNLHKRAFWVALCLCYGWQPSSLPTTCTCGTSFSIEHCLNCHQGGFTIIRHNGICDLTVRLLGEVCHQVTIEPVLQPLSRESLHSSSAITTDNATLDTKAQGFWDCSRQSAFFDVRIFKLIS